MALPRRIVRGSSYLLTRRCLLRAFRLRPSEETTHIFKYCLALALAKTGVILHAACVMSNHHHLVVTDPHGMLPVFLRELHRTCAKALNHSQEQQECLWAPEHCSVVQLATLDDVLEKIAYVAANPVAAGLVETPEDWPGLSLWTDHRERVARPKVYFSNKNPVSMMLHVESPSSMRRHSDAKALWRRRLRAAIAEKVGRAREAMRAARRAFLGRAAILAQSITEKASSVEPRRGVVPTMAASDSEQRGALRDMLRAFQLAYRAALTKWCEGARDVFFPVGTWWMRVHHGARSALASVGFSSSAAATL